MSVLVLLAYWYTYSKWYILGAWFITHILNVAFKKLWLSPLLINVLALAVLFIGIHYKLIEGQEVGASVLNVYMPIVFASIMMNLLVFAIRKVKIKLRR